MSTVIMMFILPLGILTYFWDRRNYTQSLALFRDYVSRISRSDLPLSEKMAKVDEMFYQNGYKRVEKSGMRLVVENKHFNIGLLLIFFGLLNYIGLFLYLLYYRFLLKPRRLYADLDTQEVLRG
ncbi:MAG: hypothetical protein JXK04_06210 [Campylobacterales bacterium]|nr:hypothetical protein [Campylobacterales bacterium]